MKKGLKRRIAILTVLILIVNLFSPYGILLNKVQAASGTVPDPVVVFNKIQGLTEKNGNKFFKVQIAVVGDVNLNGIDVKLGYDSTKIEPANKTSGKATTTIGLISETYPDMADGSYGKKEYDKATETYRLIYGKGGGHDLPDLGYSAGEGWDDVYEGYDTWASGFDYYLPLITYTFRVKDDSMTDDDITTDLFRLVPVKGSLPTGAQIVYFNASGVDVAYNIDKIVGVGFAEAGKEIDFIAVTKDPTKMTYEHGDTVDLTGGEITVTYVDGTTEVVDMTDSKVNIDFGQTADVSNPTSQISYGGKNTTITWTVNDPVVSLSVTKPMSDVEYDHGEKFDFAGLELTATKKSGVTVTLNKESDGVTVSELVADVNSSKFTQTGTDGTLISGTQEIEFTYEGKKAIQTVVVNDRVASVELVSQPSKNVYKYGESLNLSGASLKVNLASGGSTDINLPNGSVTVSPYSATTTGKKQNLTVSFAGVTATDTINVEVYDCVKTVTLTEPLKAEYKIGDSLSLAGGSLKLVWNSGKVTNVSLTTGMVGGFDSSSVGTKKLIVTHDENYTLSDGTIIKETFTENFDVEVENSISSITVTAPTKDKYNHGDSLNVTGGTITINYADGTKSNVPMTTAMIKEADGSNVNMSPAIGAFGSDNTLSKTLKIEYTEGGVTGSINYPITIVNDVRSIAMHTTPKDLYNVNDSLDITNGEIKVHRAVGTDEIVSMGDNRVTVSGFDSSVEHTKLSIRVEFTENGITKDTSYDIDVKDSVKSISMDNTPKTDYKYKDSLDITGGTITVVKGSETKSIPITADMVSGYDPEVLGSQKVTVTYGGQTTEYFVNVKDYVTGITITPASVSGEYGDTLADVIADNSIKYSVNYAKGGATTPVVLLESMVDGYNANTITAQNLVVKYTDNNSNSFTQGKEFTGTLTITLADEVDTIVVKAPTKDKYNHGDSLDLAGGTITVTTKSGASKTVPMTTAMIKEADGSNVNMSPVIGAFGSDNTLSKTLKIEYKEGEVTGSVNYPITIVNDVRSIAIHTTPKSLYNVNDSLDITNGEIKVHRAVGTDEIVSMGDNRVEVKGFDSSVEHTKLPIRVEFTENGITKDTSYDIDVKDSVKSIAMDNTPKTDYKYKDSLDITGGTITVVKGSETKSIPITADMVSGYDPEVLGSQKVTVTYGGQTTEYFVNVKDYVTGITITPASASGEYGDTLADVIADNSIKYSVNYAKGGATTPVVLPESMVGGYNANTITAQNLVVKYTDNNSNSFTQGKEFTGTLTITLADEVDTIVVKAPTKDKYNHGDSLDLAGGTITVTTKSGASKTVPMTTAMIKEADESNVNMSPVIGAFGSDNTLSKTLKIEYKEGEVTGSINYPITIVNDVRSIAMHTTPKDLYNVNDSLDITNGEIKVHRAVGTDEIVSMGDNRVTVSGFDSSVEHTKLPIRVEFTENGITKDTSYDIDVKDSVKSISMGTTPKTDYKYQDPIDITGGTITVVKGSETKTIPITADMVSGYDPEVLGSQKVTVTYGGQTTEYFVNVKDYVTGITITPASVSGEYGDTLADVIVDNSIKYSVNYAKGGATTPVVLLESMVDGYNANTITAQNLVVKYTDNDSDSFTQGKEFTGTLTVTLIDEVQGISMKNDPDKTDYGYNEPLDLTGGVITVSSSGGRTNDIPLDAPGVTLTEPDGSALDMTKVTFDENHKATKTIKVNYGGKDTIFTIDVTNKITGIVMKDIPKTDYHIGDNLDLTIDGIVVGTIEVTRQNGEKDTISLDNPSVDVTGFDSSEENISLQLTVSYKENEITKSTNYVASVVDEVISVEIETVPKSDYRYGDSLDVSTGTLKITKDSGVESKPIKPEMVKELDGTEFDGTKLGTRELVVTYGGIPMKYEVTVSDYIKGIVLVPPTKVKYECGESLDVVGGSVQKVMASGAATTPVALSDSSVTLSSFDSSTTGAKTIDVTYEGFTEQFGVIVEDNIQSIEIVTLPTKVDYLYGEPLSTADGKIKVIRSSGDFDMVDITPSMVSGFNPNQLGDQELTITYNDLTANYNVNVEDYVADIIVVSPDKLVYRVGESPDLTGGQVQKVMASGTATTPVAMTSAMISGFDTSSKGAKLVNVTYEGFTKTFGISVNDEISGMIIETLPKVDYKFGESLDLTGGTIAVVRDSGDKEIVDMANTKVTGFNPKKLGPQTLTVEYEGFKQDFIVNVEDYIDYLKIQAPSKLEYEFGEDLDLTNGRISIVMASGNISENIEMTASMVSGFNGRKEGNQTISVDYKGLHGNFNVNVVDKVKGIAMNTYPDKLNYNYSENLDVTGGTIVVIKSSGISVVTITNNMVSGYNGTTPGSQIINVAYAGFNAKFVVNVGAKTVQPSPTPTTPTKPTPSTKPTTSAKPIAPVETNTPVPVETPIATTPSPSPSNRPVKPIQKPEEPKKTDVLGVKEEKKEEPINTDIVAGISAIAGLLLLLILLLSRKNVKIYVEENGEFVLGGKDRIKAKKPELDVDQFLDGETFGNRVKVVLNDSISSELDERVIKIKHRGEINKYKVEYEDEPYVIMLEQLVKVDKEENQI